MSEEDLQAAGDLAYWQRRAEQAEADAAALRDTLIHGLGLANELGEGERWAEWRLQAHTILNADAGAELAAARAVAARWRDMPRYYDDCDPGQNDPYYAWWVEMDDLIDAYDAAVKARTR